jgi:hypothetical protein
MAGNTYELKIILKAFALPGPLSTLQKCNNAD